MVGFTVASGLWSAGESEFSAPNQTPSVTETGNFSLQLTPSLGWFITDQTVIGGSVTIGINDQVARRKSAGITFSEDNYNNIDFGAGTFLRHYFKSGSSFRPFTHLFFSAGSGTTKTDGFYYYTDVKGTYEGKSSSKFYYNAGLNLGVTRLLNEHTGIDLYVGYLRTSNKATMKSEQLSDYTNPSTPDVRSSFETTQKFTNNGISFGVGFQIFLGK